MSLIVKTRKVDNIVVMDLSGKLTIGEPVMQLRDALRAQIAKDVHRARRYFHLQQLLSKTSPALT